MSTIALGIDLGTTNSACAVYDGTTVQVIRNNDNRECTPSAVWLRGDDKPPMVGDAAYRRAMDSPDDVALRTKLLMGTTRKIRFSSAAASLLPEEVAAEILKSLKGDSQQRVGREIRSAVITVPAAFTLPQREATKVAATLAGFQKCELLQEPVAAGLAYGFAAGTDKRHTWMVYDLGGGTFDAALLHANSGSLEVIEHGGDEHLGGSGLDRRIVSEVLVPALLKEYPIPDFLPSNRSFASAFAQLRLEAERAKIRLSRVDSDDIVVEFRHGSDEIFFEHTLTRGDVERLADDMISSTILTCQRVLARANLRSDAVERVLLVGGPTLMPYVRERLLDPFEGLGIPLAFDVDPLTVVARGAALHAGSVAVQTSSPVAVAIGAWRVEWEQCDPVGSSNHPVVTGRIVSPSGAPVGGSVLEFVREDAASPWRTRVSLDAMGRFSAQLFATGNGQNRFRMVLIDARQIVRPIEPSELAYTIGLVSGAQRANHSIGIAMANNEVDVVIERGTSLPFTRSIIHELAFAIPAGGQLDINIPLVEGDAIDRADRNRLIGEIRLPSRQLYEDLEEGTIVHIDVSIDGSGTHTATARVDGIDELLACDNATVITVQTGRELRQSLRGERWRLREMRTDANVDLHTDVVPILERAEDLATEIERTLDVSGGDPSVRLEAENRLLSLRRALDDAEVVVSWPSLVSSADHARAEAAAIVYTEGDSAEIASYGSLVREMDAAVAEHDHMRLKRATENLRELRSNIWWRRPDAWIEVFRWLEGKLTLMSNRKLAILYVELGEMQIQADRIDELTDTCGKLMALIPSGERSSSMPMGLGGVTRRHGEPSA